MALAQRLLERRVQLLGARAPRPARGTSPSASSSTSTTWSMSRRVRLRRPTKNRPRRRALKKQSTTRLPPCGGQVDRQALLAEAVAGSAEHASRSTFSASILLMTIMRQSLRLPAQSIMRVVTISMPLCALMTMAAVSTAASAAIDCPTKSGKPGVSTRWTACCWQVEVQHGRRSECRKVFSSASKSLTVVPFSTLPAAGIAPAPAAALRRGWSCLHCRGPAGPRSADSPLCRPCSPRRSFRCEGDVTARRERCQPTDNGDPRA